MKFPSPPTNEPLLEARCETPALGSIAQEFLVLGCTAFGGPAVHIGMFKERFCDGGLRWLSNERFMELFAMANCLPGPSSTQVAFAIGVTQGGILGGLLSGFMFLTPGAVFLTLLGFCAHLLKDQVHEEGSPANAVAAACSAVGFALVFIAVAGLVKKQVYESSDPKKLGSICIASAAACILSSPTPAWMNPSLIGLGGFITILFPLDSGKSSSEASDAGKKGLPTSIAILIFVLYFGMAAFTVYMDARSDFFGLPFLTAGMFVWGGGPVVLPMLMSYLCNGPTVWIQQTMFLTGIAFAEMMPGPVFNIACYLGVQIALNNNWNWFTGMGICWLGLMGPGIVLSFAAVPLWGKLRDFECYKRALPGLNSAAVGLLVSTVFVVYEAVEKRSPWKSGSIAVALLSYCAAEMLKVSAPTIVVLAGLAGLACSYFAKHMPAQGAALPHGVPVLLAAAIGLVGVSAALKKR